MKRKEYQRVIRSHLVKAYNLPDHKIDFFLPKFLEMLNTHLANLEELLPGDNLEKLGKAGHTLKGALLNLGLQDIAQQAAIIEQNCRAGNTLIDYAGLITKIKNEIKRFT
jgi:HPt (histidine-containing phosphotransfer) domain-containing protein